MTLPEILRDIRKRKKKLTLKQVSEMTGLSLSFISDVERGRTDPSLKTLGKLLDAYKFEMKIREVKE